MTKEIQIDESISRLFNLLKVLSIFMVMTGHFFKEYGLLWVPVTVGLLIFSFSSGYFTSIRYKGDFSKKKYWKKKLYRLGTHLMVINAALLVLFVFQGRENIVSWYSLVNIIGLNGFLNWFRIPNHSPFGGGMWFFTLLLIFYVCFPFLKSINKKYISFFTVCFITGMFFLDKTIYIGHALWLTACGFIIGVWAEKKQFIFSANFSRLAAILIFSGMMWLNFKFGIKTLNFLFILFFSMTAIYGCQDIRISDKINGMVLFFSPCLLEIYLLHGYIKPAFTPIKLVNYLVSVIVVVSISKMLSIIATSLTRKMQKI